jgi:butyryl-CoA dehydrogenase
MDFALTEEQKMIQAMCRDFAQTELAPQAARLDETKDRSILKTNLKKMADLGLMGVNIPEPGSLEKAEQIRYPESVHRATQ